MTTNQSDTKSNSHPNPSAKQHATVSIQLNIVTCPTYPEKLIQDNVVAPVLQLLASVVIVTLPAQFRSFRRWQMRKLVCYLVGILLALPAQLKFYFS